MSFQPSKFTKCWKAIVNRGKMNLVSLSKKIKLFKHRIDIQTDYTVNLQKSGYTMNSKMIIYE